MMIETEAGAHTDAEEENYFISMTDMMVGVLFIFIIMLMSFALNFQKQADRQEDKISVAEEVGRKLEALEQRVSQRLAEIREAASMRTQLLHDLRDALSREGLDVKIDEANGVLRLSEDAILFPINNADLIGRARENVGKVARVLARILPVYSPCLNAEPDTCPSRTRSFVETVFIEGHTDSTGIDANNWDLSTKRAVNTFRELIVASPDLRKILNRRGSEILSVSGYASTRGIDSERNLLAYSRNRRIDLRFVMEVENEIGLREIQALVGGMKTEIAQLSRPKAP
ncbi:OmpA family protein [Methylobacterium sp. V23]|uniref:OmpA/MotB family protein n=1 Tax=Methylobacterium sp. V23 TaxID=2044878 RepID=UPI000CDA0AA1|nr:OmpA family protein [Methylobacterium sp. V23]POR41307.1 hypothetical protein CRT23_19315 [Methylobacterium sp. V23]